MIKQDSLKKGYIESMSSKMGMGRYSGNACGLYPVASQHCVDVASQRRAYWYEQCGSHYSRHLPPLPSTEERPRYLSMRESRMLVAMVLGWASFSLKTLSTTDSSVLVVSRPQKAHQSFTTIPAAMTSLPRFTVPACQRMAQCGSWHQQPKS